jgi:hypothetical protein
MAKYHVKKECLTAGLSIKNRRFLKAGSSINHRQCLTAGSSINHRQCLTAERRNRRRRADTVEAELDEAREVVLARGRARLARDTERGRRAVHARAVRAALNDLNLAERARGRHDRAAHVLEDAAAGRVQGRDNEARAAVDVRERRARESARHARGGSAAVGIDLAGERGNVDEVALATVSLRSASLEGCHCISRV